MLVSGFFVNSTTLFVAELASTTLFVATPSIRNDSSTTCS
jgi:hypothetical protein